MIANTGQDIEELEFELIDAGAEEVFEDEGGIPIYGDFLVLEHSKPLKKINLNLKFWFRSNTNNSKTY